jgi:hypothetical protein
VTTRRLSRPIPRRGRRASLRDATLAASAALASGALLVGVVASRAAGADVGGSAHTAAAGAVTAGTGRNVGRPGRSGPTATAAHVLNVKDEGHLHEVGESGSDLVEEGPVTGTVPGRVKVNFNVGPTIYSSFTIYPRGGGSISGHGSGLLHSTGKWSTFGGTITVTRGTGRYAHAHGTGQMYGVINRKTYALTVQTIGKLYY